MEEGQKRLKAAGLTFGGLVIYASGQGSSLSEPSGGQPRGSTGSPSPAKSKEGLSLRPIQFARLSAAMHYPEQGSQTAPCGPVGRPGSEASGPEVIRPFLPRITGANAGTGLTCAGTGYDRTSIPARHPRSPKRKPGLSNQSKVVDARISSDILLIHKYYLTTISEIANIFS